MAGWVARSQPEMIERQHQVQWRPAAAAGTHDVFLIVPGLFSLSLSFSLYIIRIHKYIHPYIHRRWYGPGRIERDFRQRHAIFTLHIWLIHKRLLADQYDTNAALAVDEELFNSFWDDTTCRIRQAGVHELAVNKMLTQVQQYTFLHLTHYDHAFTEFLDRPYDRLKELRKIVWMHIFVRNPAMEKAYDHLDRIAWYVDANYRNIMHEWPDEYYRESRVAWVDLPDFTHLKDAQDEVLPEAPLHPDDVVPIPWVANMTRRGIQYYWNTVTGESTWEKPNLPDITDYKKLFANKKP
jgi:cytochrome b pre-mRNA-processing protein 3